MKFNSNIMVTIIPTSLFLAVASLAMAQSSDRYYSARTPYTDARDAGLSESGNYWGEGAGSDDLDPNATPGSVGQGVKDPPTSGAYTEVDAGGLKKTPARAKINQHAAGGRSVGSDGASSSGSGRRAQSSIGSGTSRTTTGTDHGRSTGGAKSSGVTPDID